jgi:hypothetical protein
MTPPKHPERLHRGRFPKGQSGNPTGRPRGIKEPVSRGLVKNLLLEVIERNEAKVRAALERAATNPKCVLQVLDLTAKLNKEVGHSPDGRGAETHFHIHTNVNLMALKAAAHRAVQPAPTALPETESET